MKSQVVYTPIHEIIYARAFFLTNPVEHPLEPGERRRYPFRYNTGSNDTATAYRLDWYANQADADARGLDNRGSKLTDTARLPVAEFFPEVPNTYDVDADELQDGFVFLTAPETNGYENPVAVIKMVQETDSIEPYVYLTDDAIEFLAAPDTVMDYSFRYRVGEPLATMVVLEWYANRLDAWLMVDRLTDTDRLPRADFIFSPPTGGAETFQDGILRLHPSDHENPYRNPVGLLCMVQCPVEEGDPKMQPISPLRPIRRRHVPTWEHDRFTRPTPSRIIQPTPSRIIQPTPSGGTTQEPIQPSQPVQPTPSGGTTQEPVQPTQPTQSVQPVQRLQPIQRVPPSSGTIPKTIPKTPGPIRWSDFSDDYIFAPGEYIDLDLWRFLTPGGGGYEITIDPTGDDLLTGLSVVDNRYMRGAIAASTVGIIRVVRFIASKNGQQETSEDLTMATIDEGTWIPTISGGDANITPRLLNADYMRLENTVFFALSIYLSITPRQVLNWDSTEYLYVTLPELLGNPVPSELTSVVNDDVYGGSPPYNEAASGHGGFGSWLDEPTTADEIRQNNERRQTLAYPPEQLIISPTRSFSLPASGALDYTILRISGAYQINVSSEEEKEKEKVSIVAQPVKWIPFRSEHIYSIGDRVNFDLWKFLPPGKEYTITVDPTSPLPSGLRIVENRYIQGIAGSLDALFTVTRFIASTEGAQPGISGGWTMATIAEGTWTPTIAGGNTNITPRLLNANYMRLGNTVFFALSVYLSITPRQVLNWTSTERMYVTLPELAGNPIPSELTAVLNDDVYGGSPPYNEAASGHGGFGLWLDEPTTADEIRQNNERRQMQAYPPERLIITPTRSFALPASGALDYTILRVTGAYQVT